MDKVPRFSIFEAIIVLSISAVVVAGGAKYHADRWDRWLDIGGERLVTTLAQSQMNEVCPGQESGSAPSCRRFGGYRVRQTHDDSWTISRVSVESGGVSDREIVMVAGGKLYVSEGVDGRKLLSTKFEAISGVVGKSISEIAAGKS
jgi:hypothetical protein